MAKAPMKGFPNHGDVYVEEEDGEREDLGEEGGEKGEKGGSKDGEGEGGGEKESIETRLARLEGENAALRAGLSRPAPEKTPTKEPEPEPDWEKLMYDDPKGFVNRVKADVRKEITADLGGQYQKDIGEREFWGEFYSEHEDLKEDKDMVRMVLANNLKDLGDLPVSQAKKRLADLTRERIMRYTGDRKKDDVDKSKKVRVEGAGGPKAPVKTEEDSKVVTLSDIIRARRAKRNKAATA